MTNDVCLSVTDVNTYIKSIFDKDQFLTYVCIKGEISNLKFHTRGHLYFSLKDESSKINAVMFNYTSANLEFTPEDGMSVVVKGKVSVYVGGGNYQITVSSMKQDGVGNLYVLFEELKKKLASEGLFDQDKKKKLPRIPKKVGVITAPTGAAVKDIISTINRRFPLAEIILFPTLVQGESAAPNIVKMLEKADNSDVDVVILGRGGGSIEDLWAFNEEIVARAIYKMHKPIVSAVGHEIDFTISDFVADLRAPTPTGAAELVVPSVLEINRYLTLYKERFVSIITKKINNYDDVLKKYKNNYILNNPLSLYEKEEQKLDSLLDKLNMLVNGKIEKDVINLDNLKNKLVLLSPKNILEKEVKEKILRLKEEMYKSATYVIERYKSKLENVHTKLDLLNPENILDKGYSVTLKNGSIVKDISEIMVNDLITTKVKSGSIISEVKEVR